jgi:hypothetical protein
MFFFGCDYTNSILQFYYIKARNRKKRQVEDTNEVIRSWGTMHYRLYLENNPTQNKRTPPISHPGRH